MRTGPEIASFMYHEVTDDPRESGFQRPGARPYALSRDAFTRHLDQIQDGPMAPELVTGIDLTRSGRHLLLTFDDGGRSAVYAGDQLAARGWRGHFFVVTARIGEPTFLDPGQIRYLASCGHLIGSHSHSHPDIFRDLPPGRMAEQWRVSRDILEQLLGRACPAASVPGGDISAEVLASADAVGLGFLFTSEPWLVPRRTGPCWALGRFTVRGSTTPATVRSLCRFRGWRRAQLTRHLKVAASRMLPPLYRLYVRWTTRVHSGSRAGALRA